MAAFLSKVAAVYDRHTNLPHDSVGRLRLLLRSGILTSPGKTALFQCEGVAARLLLPTGMKPEMSGNPIDAFWGCFLEQKAALENASSADDPAYDEILESLQQIAPDLYFQFCTAPGANELIITAEGKIEFFPKVEEIVCQAPEVPGWKILALKPKLGFPVSTRWQGTLVTITEVKVLPVFRPSGEMGLRLYIPGLDDSNSEDIHNALLRALDAGLGERRFAEEVTATWVYPSSEAPSQAFPLTELDDYISARE